MNSIEDDLEKVQKNIRDCQLLFEDLINELNHIAISLRKKDREVNKKP